MDNGWPRVELRDVADLNPESVVKNNRPHEIDYVDIAAVSSSGIDRSAIRRLALSEAPSRAQRVVRTGDTIISTVRPYLRARALIGADLDGYVVSTGFCVIRPGPSILSGYLDAVTSTDEFYAHLESRQTGSAYPAVRPVDLGDAQIPLPPLREQRHIADVVRTLDEHIAVSRVETATAERLLVAIRDDSHFDAEAVPLGTFLQSIEGGRSLATLDRAPTPGERAVLKVSAVKPAEFVSSEAKALPHGAAMPAHALVHEGDVLITRANTAELIGAVCRVTSPCDNLYLSDKTLRLVFDEASDPAFFVHALATTDVRQQIAVAATGTSASMKNISQEKIKALRVCAPRDVDQQRKLREMFDSILVLGRQTRERTARLEDVRSRVIAALLFGQHTIPESYERLLGESGLVTELEAVAL